MPKDRKQESKKSKQTNTSEQVSTLEKKQNHNHNTKKEALGPNTER